MVAGKFGIGDLAAMGLANVGIGPLNVGNVLDTVEFVKKAWGSFGLPPSFTPTIDLGELDKRIADLKAVEQWLIVNMNMLQGTIQALEIQRGTIATLKAFGEAVGAPVAAVGPATQALAGKALAGALSAASAPAPHGNGGDALSSAQAPAAAAPPRARKPARQGRDKAASAAGGSAHADPGLSAGAWWNLLQDQFNNVANAALSGVGLPQMLVPQRGAQAAAPAAAPDEPARKKPQRTARARRADAGQPAGGGRRKV